jgi:type III restriction enzyme
MPDVLIENPILNSPFKEPGRHFKFTDEGITNEVVSGRRSSSYFIPIARPKKKGKQLAFDTEWTQDRIGRLNRYQSCNPSRHATIVGSWSCPHRRR